MRLALASLFALVFAFTCVERAAAQSEGGLRVIEVWPYARAVPGQILEVRVEGLDERLISVPADGSLQVLVTQDGSTRAVRARTATPVFVRAAGAARPEGAANAAGPPSLADMRQVQAVTFALPRGLHVGEAEVAVSYRKRRSAPFKLDVIERAQRPLVAASSIMTIAPAALPAPQTGAGAAAANRARFGLRLERGAKGVEMQVRPLMDPDDPEAGLLVRFKQGGTYFDAQARVVHRKGGRENLQGVGFIMMAPRDVLEVDVPELLAPGEAEMEVSLRAAGQAGEPALVPVTITDAERAYESPKEAAPRMLAVTPRRVGAGQALLISVDRRRALGPDPSKAEVVFETPDGAWSFKARPELNSAERDPNASADSPAFLIVRAPKQLTGTAQVRLVNSARADYEGASSEPAQVEIVAETLAPELLGAAEATKAELSQLKQLGEAQPSDSRARPIYDPSARYVAIRARGLDYSPKYLRVRLWQEGRASLTLGLADFALFSNDTLLVRVPKEFGAGPTRVSVENRGGAGYSAPVNATFELSARP